MIAFPENPEILEKANKVYITNMKIMLASDLYDKNNKIIKIKTDLPPPIGWYASEKWDGIRAIWNGKDLVSRGSGRGHPKVFSYVPEWFKNLLPIGIPLDGELWVERNGFNLVSALSNRIPNKKTSKESIDAIWDGSESGKPVIYKVFDMPLEKGPFKERIVKLKSITDKINSKFIQFTEQVLVKSEEHLAKTYEDFTGKGAEGVIIKSPECAYELKRSKFMLKFKIHQDAEGVVIGHHPGTGRLEGTLGSLEIKVIQDGEITDLTTFVGTGFTDLERTLDKNNPNFIPVGSIINFSFMEMTKDSVRHPVYRGVRSDISVKK